MVVEIFFPQDLHTLKYFKEGGRGERVKTVFVVKGVLYCEVKSCPNSFKQFLKSHVHSHTQS